MPVAVLGILGQTNAAAATSADIYTVPAARRAVASTLVVANYGADATIRVWARKAGAAAANGNTIAYDVPVPANSHFPLTEGMCLAATDVLTAQASTANVTFTLFGNEEDVT